MLPRLSSSEIARVITPGRDNNERNERGRERERERERGKTREFIIWGSGGFEATNDFSEKGGEGRSVSNQESSSTEDGIFVVE